MNLKAKYKYELDALCKAHDEYMDLQIEEEAYLTNLTLDRFKADCVSIFIYKYGLSKEEALDEVGAIENSDYLDYIQTESSTEDYVDEVVSYWGV